MITKTWSPGTEPELDNLFETLRQTHYRDTSHRFWKNYNSDFLQYTDALTICFDDNGVPEMCSSIASRDCWPSGAYRILNRLWKSNNKIGFPRQMSPSFALSAQSQIDWLSNNTGARLYFISRQTDHWEDFGISSFKHYGITFYKDIHTYLTCPNECDDTCWQKIIYNGDEKILELWKRRR